MAADSAPGLGRDPQRVRTPWLPLPYRVVSRRSETHDSATLRLAPVGAAIDAVRPGQFTMLYRSGVGEIAISVSGDAGLGDGSLTQTVRDVGAVSRALHDARPGDLVGVRGPFGAHWRVADAAGRDLLVVAGGVGLAPLRPVLLAALRDRAGFGAVTLVAGARTPAEFLFRAELDAWRARADIAVELTVDQPTPTWNGPVGFVTEPLARVPLEPARTTAFICGPEPMMRFAADMLIQRGMAATDIRVSLERNMKCGVGLCGHCQLGPLLLCRDGPVVDYALARPLLTIPEL